MTPGASFPSTSWTLPNGLSVIVAERRHLPVVSMSLLVRAGTRQEGMGQAGLASFAASLLTRGTTLRDARRLAEDIDGLGAHCGAHADSDYSVVSLSCLSRDQETGARMLAEIATSPAFRNEDVEKRRDDILSFLKREVDLPHVPVRNRFNARLYGAHPYHHPREGTVETIRSMDREGLDAFHRRQYRPANAFLAVVGDCDPAGFDRIAADAFGAWEPVAVPETVVPPLPVTATRTVDAIQKDGMTQATIRAGCLGIERRSEDYVAVSLLNYILGAGGFGSRLMKRLREREGLTYGVSSIFAPRLDRGPFYVTLQTGTETMNQALAATVEELSLLREEGVTPEELDWARRFYTGNLPLSFETNDQIATRVLERELFGLEEEYWLRDLERMDQVTPAAVHEAARRYLDVERLTVVCLADFREAPLAREFTPAPA